MSLTTDSTHGGYGDDKQMPKVAVTTTTFGQHDKRPIALLQKDGFEVKLNPYGRPLDGKEVIEICRDVIGIIAGTETLSDKVLRQLPKLKVISRCGTGLDNVDLSTARELGIRIFNTPDAPTNAVAELTVGLILNLLRFINRTDASVKKGLWKKEMGSLLCGKNVGIIGFGRIGRRVAGLLKAFDCNVAYHDPFVKDGLFGLVNFRKERLLSWADIVSVNISGKDIVLGEEELSLIKRGALLINTSRGEAVDESAAYKYLKSGDMAGAAFDVYSREPYDGPLMELENVILTPHIGSYAIEARIEMEIEAVENLLKGLREVKR